MEKDQVLEHSINQAVKHYSSMFFLPSIGKVVSALVLLYVFGASASILVLSPSISSVISGLLTGLLLFAVTLLVDFIISEAVLVEPIFNFRRALTFSLFCWVLWLPFIFLGALLGYFLGAEVWVKFCLFGLAAVLTLRFIVFNALLSNDFLRKTLAAVLYPFTCLIPLVLLWARLGVQVASFAAFIVISPFVCFLSAFYLLLLIERVGKKRYNLPALRLFRAFMLNWVAGLNEPFEQILEAFGCDVDIKVRILKFQSAKPKAAVVVSLVHPGPFKNIGSSLLPSMVKQEFEKVFHCNTCAPLGITGHEFDLASKRQCYRLIKETVEKAVFNNQGNLATRFHRKAQHGVSVSCQLFGKTALFTITLAPNTTEDMPKQLDTVLYEEAKKRGLQCTVVLNAHNSINDDTEVSVLADTVRDVALSCLDETRLLTFEPFEVGSATVYPKDFTLKDGMGPGGITAVAVKVGAQRVIYIVIDGNNMISGLREKILKLLSSMGFQDGEVLTTDTHAMTTLVLGNRGYRAIGEAIDHDKLMLYIREAAEAALNNLAPCTAYSSEITVYGLRVVGENQLKTLAQLLESAITTAKRSLLPIFGFESLILLLLLTTIK